MLLEGVRVIEVGQALAGPLAGMVLADLGADVIKIERPGGGDDARQWGPPFLDGTSLAFKAFNRNKRSVTLDLRTPDGVSALKHLAADADILIQNLRAGVAHALGIGPEAMRAEHPGLIYCSIWAFGNRGPLRDDPGFDPLAQAFGAVTTLTGRGSDPPTFCAPPINDKAAGMWCAIGALSALERRRRTGEGATIDTSLFESAVGWVEGQINRYRADGGTSGRHGGASDVIVPYQIFATATRPICIAAGNQRLWVAFCGAVGRPEWAGDERFRTGPDRVANRDVLTAAIGEVLMTADREEWVRRLRKAGVPVSPVNDVAELASSEQYAEMDMARILPRCGLEIVGLPLQIDGRRPEPYRDAPHPGEHGDEVLAGRRGPWGDAGR